MIRGAVLDDAAAIATIYAPHVLAGTASFETEPPGVADMAARLGNILEGGWPWLVFEADGAILGYAYAKPFHQRPAYGATCENSVYVAAGAHRQGIGLALLLALVDTARAAGFREMIAVIGDSGNIASRRLHAACGFRDAGLLANVGFKFGRWLDVVYMQKTL